MIGHCTGYLETSCFGTFVAYPVYLGQEVCFADVAVLRVARSCSQAHSSLQKDSRCHRRLKIRSSSFQSKLPWRSVYKARHSCFARGSQLQRETRSDNQLLSVTIELCGVEQSWMGNRNPTFAVLRLGTRLSCCVMAAILRFPLRKAISVLGYLSRCIHTHT